MREKILGAASLQVGGGADAGAGGLHSTLCAAGVDDDAKKDGEDEEERAGMAPAGAADSDQEGSTEAGRRMRVRAQPIATLSHSC